MGTTAKRWLGGIQEHATIEEDTFIPRAWILSIGGADEALSGPAHDGVEPAPERRL